MLEVDFYLDEETGRELVSARDPEIQLLDFSDENKFAFPLIDIVDFVEFPDYLSPIYGPTAPLAYGPPEDFDDEISEHERNFLER